MRVNEMIMAKASQAFPDTPADQLSTQGFNLTDIDSQVELMSSLHPNKRNKFHVVGLGTIGHGKIRKPAYERGVSRRDEEIAELKRQNEDLIAKQRHMEDEMTQQTQQQSRLTEEMAFMRSQLALLMSQSSQPSTSIPPPRDDDPDDGSTPVM